MTRSASSATTCSASQARHTDLLTRLRAAAGRFERNEGVRAEVIAVDEPADEDPRVTDALAGAVGEALANAAKHGRSSHVVVYVEPDDDELFVSVKDDGVGFDPDATDEGVGSDQLDQGPDGRGRRPGGGGRPPRPGHRGAAVGAGAGASLTCWPG